MGGGSAFQGVNLQIQEIAARGATTLIAARILAVHTVLGAPSESIRSAILNTARRLFLWIRLQE